MFQGLMVSKPRGLIHALDISLNGCGDWRPHTNGLVGSSVIILLEPLIDDGPRLIRGYEPFGVPSYKGAVTMGCSMIHFLEGS